MGKMQIFVRSNIRILHI